MIFEVAKKPSSRSSRRNATQLKHGNMQKRIE